MKNILTVDCEDWFHTDISQKYLRDKPGLHLEDRVDRNVDALLGLFREHGARATFFVLGEVAEKFPELIPKIEKKGHRIGAHGYAHTSVFLRTRVDFDKDVLRVTGLLARLASRPPLSFRAANWSVGRKDLWALEILKKYGYRYDSSLKCPINTGKRPPAEKCLIEVPRSGNMPARLPVPFGGAFLRLAPLNFMLHLMKEMNRKGLPFMVYVHPWEVDAEVPVIKTSWIDKVIQYEGIAGNLEKIKRVLGSFEFVSMEEFFEGNDGDREGLNRFYFFL